jgi:hypothetical protein
LAKSVPVLITYFLTASIFDAHNRHFSTETPENPASVSIDLQADRGGVHVSSAIRRLDPVATARGGRFTANFAAIGSWPEPYRWRNG